MGLLPAAASAAPKQASTPQLIEDAAREGRIDRDTATLYLAYAFRDFEKLPAAYRGSAPWDGTLPLRRLHRAVKRMRPGPRRDAVRKLLAPQATATGTTCEEEDEALPNSTQTANFYVEYDTVGGGLTVNDYLTSLEGAWQKEVVSFGWAPPPVAPTPAPGSKYHVRIEQTEDPDLYGFVFDGGTHAGLVGDNPATPWNEGDAAATCMVLNRDLSTLAPSAVQAALDATSAHEFNHSIQYGYGAFHDPPGPDEPEDIYAEGGANWMEDEVYDSANNNYNDLWPNFAESMGDYDDRPYDYWITFRGLTERYGTGVPGGAEQVMQDFWEESSKNSGNNLTAMQTALANRGTTLADAYHAYAIAVKFNKPCGAGYPYPYCFEEGPAYVAAKGATQVHHTLAAVGDTASGSVEDNYALNWVALPATGGPYDVTLANTSAGGQLRGTVACDTGSALLLSPLPAVVGSGVVTTLSGFSPTPCSGGRVLVITNQSQTAANPTTSTARTYQVRTTPSQAGPGPGGGPTYPVPGYPGPGGAFAVCQSAIANLINGTAGNNIITGTNVADRIFAGAGDDVVTALSGRDCVDLGAGSDRGSGGSANDLVVGAGGGDRIRGDSGDDLLIGGGSGDRIGGDSGTDVISGDPGNDRLSGGSGRDRISGGSGRDTLSGGGSGDRISGAGGRDRINGNSGNDRIRGNSGNDRMRGSSGRDRLSGGSGNDRIHSRDGRRDRVNCGSGRDRVVADDNDLIASNCETVTISASSAAAVTSLGILRGVIGGAELVWHRALSVDGRALRTPSSRRAS